MASTEHSESFLARPFGSFEAIMLHGRPDEVGDLIGQLLLFGSRANQLVGQGLNRMKDDLPHGEWEKWLRAYWPRSAREAQRYMMLARGEAESLGGGKSGTVPVRRRAAEASKRTVSQHRRESRTPAAPPQEIVAEIPADARPVPAEEHHCDFEVRLAACNKWAEQTRVELRQLRQRIKELEGD